MNDGGVEILRENFTEIWPDVKASIDKAAFIAIDSEFSGLTVNKATKSSLFDTGEERYRKSRTNVRAFTVWQFGLSAFVSLDACRYEVHTYNFYLFPVAVANYDPRTSFQASSVQFLSRYQFDFNKALYHGIPFLNAEQVASMEKYYASNASALGHVDDTQQRELIRRYCSAIARWLVQARDGDVYTHDKSTADQDELPNFVLHRKLINRIQYIWPIESRDDVLVVEKVSPEKRTQLMESSPLTSSISSLPPDAQGFSRVIHYLSLSHKMIVGHNIYLDIMFIYDKFIDHLPTSYNEYKKAIHQLFPDVYDTKHLSLELKKSLSGTCSAYQSTALSELYHSLVQSKDTQLYAPHVVGAAPRYTTANSEDAGEERERLHEAGYDSYMAGYVFLRLSHELTIQGREPAVSQYPISFYEYMTPLRQYRNKINIIRAMGQYIRLDGEDPPSNRPDCLYVRARGFFPTLDTEEVSLLLSSYGSVDICQLSSSSALVAVSNFPSARRILQAFHNHDRLSVVTYRPWLHSWTRRRVLWASLVLGIFSLAAVRSFRKRSC